MRSRRPFLFALALAALASPSLSAGCAASFDPESQINSLRVFSVAADKPYAQPGDTVKFKMEYFDGLVNPADPNAPPRKVQITWLGGCFDPVGDEYYGCYDSLAGIFQQIASGQIPPEGYIAQGIGLDTFDITLPKDIISRRPPPKSGTPYGIAYVFFAACAGTIRPVPPEGDGRAGSFPLACFDEQGNRLGADSFVPGYTQIYSFADGRKNENPKVLGLSLDGKDTGDPSTEIAVNACPVDEETRRQPPSCGKQDPTQDCVTYTFDVIVDASVAEPDPESTGPDGEPLSEAVWVDYFSNGGNFGSDLRLVSDPLTGLTPEHSTTWVAPSKPGLYTFWAVVRDARGGQTVVSRNLRVM